MLRLAFQEWGGASPCLHHHTWLDETCFLHGSYFSELPFPQLVCTTVSCCLHFKSQFVQHPPSCPWIRYLVSLCLNNDAIVL
ncbi:hypothetical protein ACRRTK_018053 [Alexandromys fortis]